MTREELDALKRETIAVLDNPVKDYNQMIELLTRWIADKSVIDQYKRGTADRWIEPLTRHLTKLKDMVNYPNLIDTPEKAAASYTAVIDSQHDANNLRNEVVNAAPPQSYNDAKPQSDEDAKPQSDNAATLQPEVVADDPNQPDQSGEANEMVAERVVTVELAVEVLENTTQELSDEVKALREAMGTTVNRFDGIKKYRHLLPDDLREMADDLPSLYAERAQSHNAAKMIQASNWIDKQIQVAAQLRRIDDTDKMIKDIYRAIDLFIAELESSEPVSKEIPAPYIGAPTGSLVLSEIERIEDTALREACKLKRIENNKKYIRRSDARPEEVTIRQAELDTWGVEYKK